MLFGVYAGIIANLYTNPKILFTTGFLKKTSKIIAGSTPLHLACFAGSSDVAEYLINHTADLHRISDKRSCNGSHGGSYGGEIDVCSQMQEVP